jgi:hypothetical protein
VPFGVAALLVTGCFTYRPAELSTLPEGGQVRVQLTRQGFAALPEMRTQSGPRLSGTLVSRNDDQLRLRVAIADELNKSLGQEFVIPAHDVVQFETRELSRTRTALASVGGIAAAAALYLTFEKGNPFSRDDPEPPEEEEPFRNRFLRVLRFSIPVR